MAYFSSYRPLKNPVVGNFGHSLIVSRSGPSAAVARAYHTCNIVTDCYGDQQVVVVGGVTGVTATGVAYTNVVEIYDVRTNTWGTGEFISSVKPENRGQGLQNSAPLRDILVC